MKTTILLKSPGIFLFVILFFSITLLSALEDNIENQIVALMDQYQTGNSAQRLSAINSCIRLDDLRSIDILMLGLQDEDSFIRKRAAEGLGFYSHYRAVYPLIDQLRLESDIWVQQAIIEALGYCESNYAILPLREFMRKTDDFVLQEKIIDALVQIGIEEETARNWIDEELY